MAKGYNRYNYLLKVKAVCEIYTEEKKKNPSITAKNIYEQRIKNVFFISNTTFFKCLAMNYKKELAEIEKQREKQLN